jgi:hypothetical protein
MKKLLAIVLALSLLGSVALAETLTIDLNKATLEELTAAQSAIGDRISELRAANVPAGEAIKLSGTGTAIQSGVEVTQVPSRVAITGAVAVTLTGGSYDLSFNLWEKAYSCEALTEAGTYDILVEGEGDWTIAIEPLKDGGTLECSGTGPTVTDFFPLTGATIVHCAMDASSLDEWSVGLYAYIGYEYESFDSWTYDTVVGDYVSSPLKLEGDGIVKPVKGRDQYYWIIDVPDGATWSVSLK